MSSFEAIPSTSSGYGGGGGGGVGGGSGGISSASKKICEVCGSADRRPTSSFLQNIITCEACKKFLERCQKQNKVKLRCKTGGRQGVACKLDTDRPCPKCRLDKAIQLVTRMKATTAATGAPVMCANSRRMLKSAGAGCNLATMSASSSSCAQQLTSMQAPSPLSGMATSTTSTTAQNANGNLSCSSASTVTGINGTRSNNLSLYFQKCTETDTIETVKKLQLKVELLKYLKRTPQAASAASPTEPPTFSPASSSSQLAASHPVHSSQTYNMTPIIDNSTAYNMPSFMPSFGAASSNIPDYTSGGATITEVNCSSNFDYPSSAYSNNNNNNNNNNNSGYTAMGCPSTSGTSGTSTTVQQYYPLPRSPSMSSSSSSLSQQASFSCQALSPSFASNFSPSYLPLSPVMHDNVRNEMILHQIMMADKELTAKKYRCDANFLLTKGIPEEENEFWKLVSWCTQDLALANLPFATKLAGGLRGISHIDMCRLVENSYALMFYAQTGLPNRLDVVSAFGMLFTKMRHAWKEIDMLMEHTREIVTAIREWKPSSSEFAFLLASIFCNAVPREKVLVPETLSKLDHLKEMVMAAANAHFCQMYGPKVAPIRFQQLQCIIAAVIKQRESRRYALSRFYERHPKLAYSTVAPVVEVVCRQFKDQWQQDYSEVRLPCYPPPINYELRRGIDEFTDVLMANI